MRVLLIANTLPPHDLSGVGEQVFSELQHFPGNRDEVRRQTVKAALEGLLRHAAGEISNQG